jgi:hypothetical protein
VREEERLQPGRAFGLEVRRHHEFDYTLADSTICMAPFPPNTARIEVRVAELKQLFNSIDPSPFRERDLAREAEEFIVEWAREVPRDAPLALLVHLDRPPGRPGEAAELQVAVREYFTHEADVARQRLRHLFRIGRTSLLIGLAFLGTATVCSQLIVRMLPGPGVAELLAEVLIIGGWVAMWRPLEIFLYDWWPIRAEEQLYRRLSAMPVDIAYVGGRTDAEAWQRDWPAASMRGNRR